MPGLAPENDNRAPVEADLARELRRALDALADLVEDANAPVCTIEDAHGLEFPGREEIPDADERSRARAGLAAALDDLARRENAMRRQIWQLARARRTLARLARAGRAAK
jgi:hypothetical protein